MKKLVLTIFLLLSFSSLSAQNYHFTSAPNGLVVREKATTASERVGKLVYGSLAEIIEETNISYQFKENSITKKSVWVKIKYDNFPYLDINDKYYERDKTGYVLKHYLQKLNKARITTKEINKTVFNASYKEPTKSNRIKQTSFETVKKALSGRVKWANSSILADGTALDMITLPNGQTLDIDQNSIDFSFIAYFPSEEILLFEGGHTSDFSISIKTGESLKTVGNPEYFIDSPTKKYRLNGWFPGQECSSYFFQKKTSGNYTYLVCNT